MRGNALESAQSSSFSETIYFFFFSSAERFLKHNNSNIAWGFTILKIWLSFSPLNQLTVFPALPLSSLLFILIGIFSFLTHLWTNFVASNHDSQDKFNVTDQFDFRAFELGLAMRMRNMRMMRIMRICGICGLKISSTLSTYEYLPKMATFWARNGSAWLCFQF